LPRFENTMVRKILFAVILMITFSSCVDKKKLVYFNNLETPGFSDTTNKVPSLVIHSGDILQITVSTIDRDITALFNPNNVLNATTNTTIPIAQGYLVDKEGNVELPVIGKSYVRGLTIDEANEALKRALSETLKNVFVSTRLLNFKVSVLGDVARPGNYNITNERVSILDALSLAGDANITAERKDVLLIREVEGKKTYVSLDLTDRKTLTSPYYYLLNNDVLYIKPGPNRLLSNSATLQLLPTILGGLSLITVLLSTILK
jgi:polysaccharide biosynthesis/export protein